MPAPPPALAIAAFIGVAAAGCGGQTAPGHGNPDGGGIGGDAGPLPGTAGSWTWVDVPGMGCDDGSPTGVGDEQYFVVLLVDEAFDQYAARARLGLPVDVADVVAGDVGAEVVKIEAASPED